MTILDVIRKRTYELKDSLANVKQQISQAESERNAAEESWKRTRSEISKKNDEERKAKEALTKVGVKISELKKTQEELEHKLQETNEAYFLYLEEETAKQKELRNAENAVKTAIAEMNKHERAKEDAEEHVAKLKADQEKSQALFSEQLVGALEDYLGSQTEHLQSVFQNEEQTMIAKQEQEEFEKLRHSDHRIAELWEQRHELSGLLANAKIAAVRNILQERLDALGEELKKMHPGAIRAEVIYREDTVEEMLYYFNQEDKAVLLLPVLLDDWDKLEKGEVSDRTSRVMCIVWNMIKEMKLKSQDGSFIPSGRFVTYESCLVREDISLLQGFRVKCKNSEISRFILTEVPSELQEAMSHEN